MRPSLAYFTTSLYHLTGMFYQIAHTESLWNEKQFGKDLSLPVASTTRNFRIFVIGSQGPGQWYLVAWRKWPKEGERVAWFLLTKVTYFSHITSSNTKFDQISSSEYWLSTNFKISTSTNISICIKLKIQDIDQTQLQKLNHDSTSWPRQNISSKILSKLQLQNIAWTSTQNLSRPCAPSLN